MVVVLHRASSVNEYAVYDDDDDDNDSPHPHRTKVTHTTKIRPHTKANKRPQKEISPLKKQRGDEEAKRRDFAAQTTSLGRER